MTNREIFSRNLQKYMDQNNMNQTDVAKQLGLNRATVSAWITKRGYPRFDVLIKLSDLFGVEATNLIADNNDPETDESKLLKMFNSLNSIGKEKLLERAEELSILYGKKDNHIPNGQVHNA